MRVVFLALAIEAFIIIIASEHELFLPMVS